MNDETRMKVVVIWASLELRAQGDLVTAIRRENREGVHSERMRERARAGDGRR